MKTIAIITSTRAEFGLFSPVIKAFEKRKNEINCELVVTGTHLMENYGFTVNEIIEQGVRIDVKIPINLDSTNELTISNGIADAITKFTILFMDKKYDAIMVLGDRYEILGVSIAASVCKIPIFHLCGGDITEGLIDEFIRHSISKMSYLHFVTNEVSRKRVIQLGEDPRRVFNVGSTSVENIQNLNLYSKEKALKSVNLGNCKYALCTYHPVTLEKMDVKEQMKDFIEAIECFPEIEFIVTKSNSDLGGNRINDILDENESKVGNLHVYTSLGMKRYLSLMKSCEFVLGNSSSGIIEAPILRVPTVDIGDRQKGRLKCDSIINCKADKNSIVAAIHKALSIDTRLKCNNMTNPYGDGNTSNQIVSISIEMLKKNIELKKRFYDIKEEIL